MSRFVPGDVVIHKDHPSRTEVVLRVLEPLVGLHVFTTVRDPNIARAESQYHTTGMRQVLARPREQMRYGR